MSAPYVIEKVASSDLATCEGIMRRIYDENPSHWPYGLNTEQLRGGLYMVREANTKAPVGFVGWQEENQGMRKVGYYSIGILPEYRRRGWAKSAVQQIIRAKSAGVDEVRAMIHVSNDPSMELAKDLDVPIEKVAMEKEAMGVARRVGQWLLNTPGGRTTTALGAGTGMGTAWDRYIYSDKDFFDADQWDKARTGNFIKNFGIGSIAPWLFRKNLGLGVAETTMGVPATNALMQYLGEGEQRRTSVQQEQQKLDMMKQLGIGAGVLGLGGLGIAAYNAFKPRDEEEREEAAREQIMRSAQGKIRITLPTKNPNDNETEIELPFDADTINMSNAMQGALGRDIRRRLRDEAKSRIRRRGEPVINTAARQPSLN